MLFRSRATWAARAGLQIASGSHSTDTAVHRKRAQNTPTFTRFPRRAGRCGEFTPDSADSIVPGWSHDGRWIYYLQSDGSRQETWKAPFEGGAPVQVAKFGMFDMTESPDGRYLYYTNEVGQAGSGAGERPRAIRSWLKEPSGSNSSAIGDWLRVGSTLWRGR